MSRAVTGGAIEVKPGHNIYTVLVIVATVAQIIGLVAVAMRANTLFDKGIIGSLL